MIKLTEQMRELIDPALAKGTPCLVATASKDGVPNIGYKGSVMVFDDESLAYWERTRQGTLQNVEENPNVMILFRDPALGVYRKLQVRDGRLAGAVLIGNAADGAWYAELIRDRVEVEPFRDGLIFGRRFCELEPAPAPTLREAA